MLSVPVKPKTLLLGLAGIGQAVGLLLDLPRAARREHARDDPHSKCHLGVRLTPHRLRHAYGKHCVDRGVDIRIIAEALGHESLESTKIYTQVSFERTRQITELFSHPRS